MAENLVVFRTFGAYGWITLNRPQSLNALTLEMIKEIDRQLSLWELNPDIEAIVIEGKGRAFCAGGDIRLAYEAWQKKDAPIIDEFFRCEYALNKHVSQCCKPYIALLTGITFGGGMGISIHGSHRIITEEACLGMPETIIGYFPDVGASYFLNQCPGYSGLYTALTGNSICPGDALYMGLATHFMPKSKMLSFIDNLQKGSLLDDDFIRAHSALMKGQGPIELNQDLIDYCFGKPDLNQVFQSLLEEKSLFAKETLDILRIRCPESLKITFDYFQRAKLESYTCSQAIEEDYRMSQKLAFSPNFIEGIRAAIVDKDRQPKWVESAIG